MGRHASRILSSDCTQHNQNLQEDVFDKFTYRDFCTMNTQRILGHLSLNSPNHP